MVKLQRKSARNTQPMLSEIAKDKEYLRAAEIIQRAEKNGRRLGFYEPDKDESI